MEKKDILPFIQSLRQETPKRKFSQSIDLVVNLKNLNLKKEGDQVNAFISLPHERGKKVRITALVGPELESKAKKNCDHVFTEEQFSKLDKKAIKKLAAETDYFIAQANIMPRVAGIFGKILGPRGLMPSPKSGGIIPSTADIEQVVKRFKTLIKLETKNELAIKARIGTEVMPDESIADNALFIVNTLLQTLPQDKNNIKSIILKMTMGAPIVFDSAGERKEIKKPEPKEKKQQPPKQEEKQETATKPAQEIVKEEKPKVKKTKKKEAAE